MEGEPNLIFDLPYPDVRHDPAVLNVPKNAFGLPFLPSRAITVTPTTSSQDDNDDNHSPTSDATTATTMTDAGGARASTAKTRKHAAINNNKGTANVMDICGIHVNVYDPDNYSQSDISSQSSYVSSDITPNLPPQHRQCSYQSLKPYPMESPAHSAPPNIAFVEGQKQQLEKQPHGQTSVSARSNVADSTSGSDSISGTAGTTTVSAVPHAQEQGEMYPPIGILPVTGTCSEASVPHPSAQAEPEGIQQQAQETEEELYHQLQNIALVYGDESSLSPTSGHVSRCVSRRTSQASSRYMGATPTSAAAAALPRRISYDAGIQPAALPPVSPSHRSLSQLATPSQQLHATAARSELSELQGRRSSVQSRHINQLPEAAGFVVLGQAENGAHICESDENDGTFLLVIDLEPMANIHSDGVQCSPDDIITDMEQAFALPITHSIGIQTGIDGYPTPYKRDIPESMEDGQATSGAVHRILGLVPGDKDEAVDDPMSGAAQVPVLRYVNNQDVGGTVSELSGTNGDKVVNNAVIDDMTNDDGIDDTDDTVAVDGAEAEDLELGADVEDPELGADVEDDNVSLLPIDSVEEAASKLAEMDVVEVVGDPVADDMVNNDGIDRTNDILADDGSKDSEPGVDMENGNVALPPIDNVEASSRKEIARGVIQVIESGTEPVLEKVAQISLSDKEGVVYETSADVITPDSHLDPVEPASQVEETEEENHMLVDKCAATPSIEKNNVITVDMELETPAAPSAVGTDNDSEVTEAVVAQRSVWIRSARLKTISTADEKVNDESKDIVDNDSANIEEVEQPENPNAQEEQGPASPIDTQGTKKDLDNLRNDISDTPDNASDQPPELGEMSDDDRQILLMTPATHKIASFFKSLAGRNIIRSATRSVLRKHLSVDSDLSDHVLRNLFGNMTGAEDKNLGKAKRKVHQRLSLPAPAFSNGSEVMVGNVEKVKPNKGKLQEERQRPSSPSATKITLNVSTGAMENGSEASRETGHAASSSKAKHSSVVDETRVVEESAEQPETEREEKSNDNVGHELNYNDIGSDDDEANDDDENFGDDPIIEVMEPEDDVFHVPVDLSTKIELVNSTSKHANRSYRRIKVKMYESPTSVSPAGNSRRAPSDRNVKKPENGRVRKPDHRTSSASLPSDIPCHAASVRNTIGSSRGQSGLSDHTRMMNLLDDATVMGDEVHVGEAPEGNDAQEEHISNDDHLEKEDHVTNDDHLEQEDHVTNDDQPEQEDNVKRRSLRLATKDRTSYVYLKNAEGDRVGREAKERTSMLSRRPSKEMRNSSKILAVAPSKALSENKSIHIGQNVRTSTVLQRKNVGCNGGTVSSGHARLSKQSKATTTTSSTTHKKTLTYSMRKSLRLQNNTEQTKDTSPSVLSTQEVGVSRQKQSPSKSCRFSRTNQVESPLKSVKSTSERSRKSIRQQEINSVAQEGFSDTDAVSDQENDQPLNLAMERAVFSPELCREGITTNTPSPRISHLDIRQESWMTADEKTERTVASGDSEINWDLGDVGELDEVECEIEDEGAHSKIIDQISMEIVPGSVSQNDADVGDYDHEGGFENDDDDDNEIVGIASSRTVSKPICDLSIGPRPDKVKKKKKKVSKRKRKREPIPRRPRKSQRLNDLRVINYENEEDDHDDLSGLRRSQRQRFPILKFWKNEAVRFERRMSQSMPHVSQVVVDAADDEDDEGLLPCRR